MTNKGHGRIETRKIWISRDLEGYTKFPHCKQVFRIESIVWHVTKKKETREVRFGVTSLAEPNPKRLLARARGHWTIEARLHYVRDVTFDEDRSRVRRRSGPQVMATLRNVAISLLRLAGAKNIAAAVRYCMANQAAALRLIGL